jgi:hypothetical protein
MRTPARIDDLVLPGIDIGNSVAGTGVRYELAGSFDLLYGVSYAFQLSSVIIVSIPGSSGIAVRSTGA